MTDTAHRSAATTAGRIGAAADRSELLQAVARRSMSPDQQAEALRAAQARAEQRVKLGMQLFKAAESKLGQQSDLLERIKADQQKLREDVQDDVARTLQSYDQWMGQIDESFTTAVADLQSRLDHVEQSMESKLQEMRGLADRAETILRLVEADVEVEPEPARDPVTGRIEGEPIPMPHWPSMQAQDPGAPGAPGAPGVPTAHAVEPPDATGAAPLPMTAPHPTEDDHAPRADVFRRVLGRLKQDEDPGPAAA